MSNHLSPPRTPNGCISMWFSKTGSRHKWIAIAGSTALSSYFFEYEDDFWAYKKSAATPEGEQIISLATKLDQAQARIKELEDENKDLKENYTRIRLPACDKLERNGRPINRDGSYGNPRKYDEGYC